MDHLTTGMKTIWIYCCYFICNTIFFLLIVFLKFQLNLYLSMLSAILVFSFISRNLVFFSIKKHLSHFVIENLSKQICPISPIFILYSFIFYYIISILLLQDVTLLAFFGKLIQSLSDPEQLHSLPSAQLFCKF